MILLEESMKKGFTLIELLIVMIIVGILTAVAIPKYYSGLERGRMQEGLTNLRAASDLINTHYVLHDNNYNQARRVLLDRNGVFTVEARAGFTKSRFFTVPVWRDNDDAHNPPYERIVVTRVGNDYTLMANNLDGELKEIVCTRGANGDADICDRLGMEKDPSDNRYKMTFTN